MERNSCHPIGLLETCKILLVFIYLIVHYLFYLFIFEMNSLLGMSQKAFLNQYQNKTSNHGMSQHVRTRTNDCALKRKTSADIPLILPNAFTLILRSLLKPEVFCWCTKSHRYKEYMTEKVAVCFLIIHGCKLVFFKSTLCPGNQAYINLNGCSLCNSYNSYKTFTVMLCI